MKVVQINATCGKGSTGKIVLSISKLLTEQNIENYILFHRLSEELNPGYSLSDSSEGLSPKGNEKPGYIGGSAKQKQVKKKKN